MITEPFGKISKIFEAEKTLGLKLEPTKWEIFFLGNITEKRRLTILASFQKLYSGIRTPKKMKLSILVHLSTRNHKQTYW